MSNYETINSTSLLNNRTPNEKRRCALFFFLVWTFLVFALSVAALSKAMEVSIAVQKTPSYPTQLTHNFDLLRANNIVEGKVLSIIQNTQSKHNTQRNNKHYNNNIDNDRGDVNSENNVNSNNNNNNQLVVGAGTSVYSINTFLQSQNLKHVAIANLDAETFVVAFMGNLAQLMVGQLAADSYTVQWGMPLNISIEVDGLICLNSTTCVLLGSPYVALLTVNNILPNQPPSLTIGNLVRFTNGMSVEPVITNLGGNGFALSYYEGLDEITLNTRYGSVLANGISLSTPVEYGPDYSSHGIIGLSENTYLLVFVNSTQFTPGELTLIYAQITSSNIVLNPAVSLINSQAFYFFDGVSINANLAVVAFVDVGMDNALRVITIEIENGLPTFAAGLVINSGDATGLSPLSLWMFISVSYVSQNSFVVVYSDLANGLAVTVSIIEFTETMSLTESNSGWVLTVPSPTLEGYYFVSSTSLSPSRFLVFESLYESGVGKGGQITLGEIKGQPVGVMTSDGVVLWGLLKVSQTLQAGVVYYSNTKGDIVQSDGTDDAKLGVAVNSNTLYLSLAP